MSITTSVQRNWKERRWQGADLDTYYYFDINAGAGCDPTGLVGSPLIFARQAQAINLTCQAVFIERDEINALRLAHELSDAELLRDCSIHVGDHSDVLPHFFVNGPQRFGLVYSDPSGTVPPFDLLANMSRQPIYKRLDICIYVHATNIKRVRLSSKANEQRSLHDFIGTIDKKEWIVREPVGKEQWSFLIGSNWIDFPDWANEGFHKWKSPQGKEIFDKLTYSADEIAERKGQLSLPFFDPPSLVTGHTETTQSI